MNTLKNDEVNLQHYRKFNTKFYKFYESSEILKSKSEKLIQKCALSRIPGKYIFRHEHYTDEILKFVKSMENKIFTEKHK